MLTTVNERIAAVRELMKANGISAIIIPGADPHMSEYFSEHWATTTFISGFTGETGTVVITMDMAGLWTDGRYYIQAANELSGSEVVLFRASEPETKKIPDYLLDNLAEGSVVGINGKLFSAAYVKTLKEKWAAKNITINTDVDFANDVWENRPIEEHTPVYCLGVEYAGKTAAEKLQDVREELKKLGADSLVISKLDNIAWLLNLRANDVMCNPVLIAYALILGDKTMLFTDLARVGEDVRSELNANSVELREYDEIFAVLPGISEEHTVVCDENEANASLYEACAANPKLTVINKSNPIVLLKACKNEVETENTYKAYLYDGIAEAEFYAWLEEEMELGHEHTEWTLSEKLHSFRAEQPGFKGDSFTAIIAVRENAAMMHYGPQPDTAKKVEHAHLLLNDSGGQYLTGTTDTTRTIAMGEISDEERRDFTLVVKGVIALSTAKFKEGICGKNLDVLARQPVWQLGIDYRCGTGHGVGYLLNVHEGPHGFRSEVPLREGMVVTIEPGVYTEGSHGIRIENTVVVRKDVKTEYAQFYRFDTFTVVPIDTDCLDIELMTKAEIDWLNAYHAHVYETVAPHLSERAKSWLARKTKRI